MKFIAVLQNKSSLGFRLKKNSFLKNNILNSKTKIKIENIKSLNRKLHLNFFIKGDNKEYSHSVIDNFEIVIIGSLL